MFRERDWLCGLIGHAVLLRNGGFMKYDVLEHDLGYKKAIFGLWMTDPCEGAHGLEC